MEKALTLTELHKRAKAQSPIYLTRKEFIQYMDMVMPKDALYFSIMVGREQLERDRKKILRKGVLRFCGKEVIMKKEPKD